MGLEHQVKQQAIDHRFLLSSTTVKEDEEGMKAEAGTLSGETRLSFSENNKDEILPSTRLSKVKAHNADSQVRIPVNRGLTEPQTMLMWNRRSNTTN